MDINRLSYFVLDVDGTMTDTGVYYDDSGRELKKFSTRDYVGVMAAHYVGIKLLVVTGRESSLTERRMKEMKIDYIFQGIKNKKSFIQEFMNDKGVKTYNLGYLGDDLNDYAAMSLAGFKACPQDAALEIRQKADYVCNVNGGGGAIQDVFRYLLKQRGQWENFMEEIIEKGY